MSKIVGFFVVFFFGRGVRVRMKTLHGTCDVVKFVNSATAELLTLNSTEVYDRICF